MLALDIVEGFMAPIYYHQHATDKVSKTVPPRPPKKKPGVI